ncbi:MAG TPA: hemolysin III family protein [Actinomycetota bacterium]|jgi:hemolysin III|nr:hemolysin III family protein [Actinomycetota bacterium]
MDRSPTLDIPRLRGRLHQAAFWASLPAGFSVIALARTEAARAGVIVYALTLSGLYAASAAYHRVRWSPGVWAWMRRLDHSMIFLFIAGSYTPLSLLVLDPPWSSRVLAIVWGGAGLGIALKLFVRGWEAVAQVLYMTLGWLAIFILPQLVATMSGQAIGLLFGGGVLYTAGAVVFGLRRPNPNPLVFGFHEVWHALVICGSLCHYVLILLLLMEA